MHVGMHIGDCIFGNFPFQQEGYAWSGACGNANRWLDLFWNWSPYFDGEIVFDTNVNWIWIYEDANKMDFCLGYQQRLVSWVSLTPRHSELYDPMISKKTWMHLVTSLRIRCCWAAYEQFLEKIRLFMLKRDLTTWKWLDVSIQRWHYWGMLKDRPFCQTLF